MGGGPQSPSLQTPVDTEQIRNLQDCETYGVHVSNSKKNNTNHLLKHTNRYIDAHFPVLQVHTYSTPLHEYCTLNKYGPPANIFYQADTMYLQQCEIEFGKTICNFMSHPRIPILNWKSFIAIIVLLHIFQIHSYFAMFLIQHFLFRDSKGLGKTVFVSSCGISFISDVLSIPKQVQTTQVTYFFYIVNHRYFLRFYD